MSSAVGPLVYDSRRGLISSRIPPTSRLVSLSLFLSLSLSLSLSLFGDWHANSLARSKHPSWSTGIRMPDTWEFRWWGGDFHDPYESMSPKTRENNNNEK